MSEWQPIATAPKSTSIPCGEGHHVIGDYFLAYCPDESMSNPKANICICWWEPHLDGKGRWQGEGDYALRPTHWMPLPEPP